MQREHSRTLVPRPASALLCDTWASRKLSLGCSLLDACLEGGIDSFGITEIAGEAGAGKTQLVLQLLLQSQLPAPMGGLAGGAIYLHGDNSNVNAALKRIDSLAAEFAVCHANVGAQSERLKENIFVLQVDTAEELWETVDQRVPALLRERGVRLLVIDSIAGLHRGFPDEPTGVNTTGQYWQRTQQLLRLSARLKQLSETFCIAVVVTNQVTDKPLDNIQRRCAAQWELGPCGKPDGSMRVPALGLSWSFCVNTRIILTRHAVGDGLSNLSHGGSDWHRALHVAWSPRMPEASVQFQVRNQGVVGVR